jgi:diguanylate cyclase (GGDEF)-like protein/PAS domain S-box-containing protein
MFVRIVGRTMRSQAVQRLRRWLSRRIDPGPSDASTPIQEERLLRVLTNIPALVAHFDLEGRCLFANERALQIYNLSLQQTAGMRLSDLLSVEEYGLYLPHLPAVLAGQRASFEGVSVRNARNLHYQVILVPEKAPDGTVVGYVLMTSDVTALRETQDELQRSETRLRAITDNVPVAILYVDAERRIQFANRTCVDWSGQPLASVVGRPLRNVMGEALYTSRDEVLGRALRGERVTFEMETPINGVPRDLQTLYMPDDRGGGDVRGVYVLATDITSLRTAEREMAKLAMSDPLTQLPNRRRLDEHLIETLARSRRASSGIGVLFLDVDHFKRINDTHGHAAGDAVLVAFAARLSASVRDTDFVARFAGDEFVVVLEGLGGSTELEGVAGKIVAGMAKPLLAGPVAFQISTSVGAVFVAPNLSVTPSALLRAADEALYQVKSAGRNGFVLNVPDLQTG